MNSNKAREENEVMTKVSWQTWVVDRISGVTVTVLAAGLLILTSAIFHWKDLGQGHVILGGFWLLPLIVDGPSNMLAVDLHSSVLEEIVRYLPYLLGLGGCTALLALRRVSRTEAAENSAKGDAYDR
jgi:hypothetical protein